MKDKHTKPNLQSRRKYSKEFKDELVRRLLDGESATELSRHFGVSSSLLYRWKVDYLHRMDSSDEDVRSVIRGHSSPQNFLREPSSEIHHTARGNHQTPPPIIPTEVD